MACKNVPMAILLGLGLTAAIGCGSENRTEPTTTPAAETPATVAEPTVVPGEAATTETAVAATPGEGLDMALVARGARFFKQYGCDACHTPGQKMTTGAPLEGIFGHEVELEDGSKVVADEAYLRESILNPSAKVVKGFQPVMMSFDGVLDEPEVDALIEYIKSLKPAEDTAAH